MSRVPALLLVAAAACPAGTHAAAPPGPYLLPHGLRRADVGDVGAPTFFRAVLGQGTEAEQEAAVRSWATGRRENYAELLRVAERFRRRPGAQALVWRDTATG